MDDELWRSVDAYLEATLVEDDPALSGALEEARRAGLPPINVSPSQGKFLHLIARLQSARSILEVGTLAGYSAIWLARALVPGGRMVSLEIDPVHAEVATANLARAGLGDAVEIRVGRAEESLQALVAEGDRVFDLVFIDADKKSTPTYLEAALALTAPGSLIVIDNVVRAGRITDSSGRDPHVEGIRRALEMVAAEPTLSASALQTVGSKGYDGFAIALVLEGA